MSAEHEPHAWAQVQELLDARRDPRADVELLRGLERDEPARAELERLCRRLARLERAPRASAPAWIAAAALLLAPLALWAALRSADPAPLAPAAEPSALLNGAAPAPPAAAASAPATPFARVLHLRLVAETLRDGELVVTTTTADSIEQRHVSTRQDTRIVLAWTHKSPSP